MGRGGNLESVEAELLVSRMRAVPLTQRVDQLDHLAIRPAPVPERLKNSAKVSRPGANVAVQLHRLGHRCLNDESAKAGSGKREHHAPNHERKFARALRELT